MTMMPRSLLALNGALAVAVVLFATQVARVYMAPAASRAQPARTNPSRPTTARPIADAGAPGARPGLTSYASIASKSVFSPNRSDPDATAAAAPMVGPKPILYGIVLRDGGSIAYLEDPTTKRIAGYRIGDTIAGGVLQTIVADHIVLKRGEGSIDVPLKDPSKPRPAVAHAPASPAQPGAPPPTPAAVARPPLPAQPTGAVPPPATSAVPPNLLRRLQLPPPTGRDAAGR